MRTHAYEAVLVVLTVTFVCLGQTKTEQYRITGRVIDSGGKPLPGIAICFEPDIYRGGFDRFIECSETDIDGKFADKVGRHAHGQLWFLYVYDESGTKGIDFLDPPFDWLRRRDKTFNGIPVRFGEKSLIDLGDVNVRFYFGDAILDFSQLKIKTKTNVNWDDLYIAVRHRNGRYVAYSSLSSNDIEVSGNVDKPRSTLRVTLPEGRWKVEGIWDDKVLAASSYFKIIRTASSPKIIMRPLRAPRHIHPNKL